MEIFIKGIQELFFLGIQKLHQSLALTDQKVFLIPLHITVFNPSHSQNPEIPTSMLISVVTIALANLAALASARPSLEKRGGFPGVATFNDYIKQVMCLANI